MIAAVLITARRSEARGGDRALVHDVALWGFPAGMVGARLYFLATSWNEVPDHWWGLPLARERPRPPRAHARALTTGSTCEGASADAGLVA